jgi:hypothetical protein
MGQDVYVLRVARCPLTHISQAAVEINCLFLITGDQDLPARPHMQSKHSILRAKLSKLLRARSGKTHQRIKSIHDELSTIND